jgi:hypothetical protein
MYLFQETVKHPKQLQDTTVIAQPCTMFLRESLNDGSVEKSRCSETKVFYSFFPEFCSQISPKPRGEGNGKTLFLPVQNL